MAQQGSNQGGKGGQPGQQQGGRDQSGQDDKKQAQKPGGQQSERGVDDDAIDGADGLSNKTDQTGPTQQGQPGSRQDSDRR